MKKVVLTGTIEVPAASLDAVRVELPCHVAATLAEEGCIVFEVEEVRGDPGCFNVYEEFSSRRAFELHQLRVAGSRWGELTVNASRDYSVREEDSG